MRAARSRSVLRRASIALLALVVPAAAGAGRPSHQDLLGTPNGLLTSGELAVLDVGDVPRPALGQGFYWNERDNEGRSFAWSVPEVRVRFLIAESPRTLVVTARAGKEGQTVRAFFNGVDLGERALPLYWAEMTWDVAVDVVRAGVNEVRLVAANHLQMEGDQRQLAVAYDRIEARDSSGSAAATTVEPVQGPVQIPAGGFLCLPFRFTPEAHLAFTVGPEEPEVPPPAGTVRLVWEGGRKNLGRLGAGGALEFDLEQCCAENAWVVIEADQGQALRLTGVTVDSAERQMAWRTGCGVLPFELLTLLGLGLAVLGLAWLTARPRFVAVSPMLDVLLLLVVAAAVRMYVHDTYPTLSWSRFGDSWEYLYRARKFERPDVTFFGTTDWHQWSGYIRPFGYFAFLALILVALGGTLATVVQVQLVLSILTVIPVYVMARQLFGRRAAIITGLLLALSVEAATLMTIVMTETVFTFLLAIGLAIVVALTVRERVSWWLPLLGGLILGVASVTRSGPSFYVPCAAVVLVLVHGLGRGWKRGALLWVGMLLITVPWSIRNSIVVGKPMGVHNITTAGFLIAHPDQSIIPHEDLDLTKTDQFFVYFGRVKAAMYDNPQVKEGKIVGPGLIKLIKNPGYTIPRFLNNVVAFFEPFRNDYPAAYLGEARPCRAAVLADAMNLVLLTILVFGAAGVVLHIRDPRVWPMLLWPVLISTLVPLIFYPDQMPGRFRYPTQPVLMAFAGAALIRLGDTVLRRLPRRADSK